MNTQKARGFTLIELLVVVAIIAMLASIILASLNQARTKSRDARRVADVKQIQLALELYYNDNTSYPIQGTFGNLSGLQSALVPTYISAMPSDPGSYAYQYQSLSDGTVGSAVCSSGKCYSYILQVQLENNNTSILNQSAQKPTNSGATCTITNPYYYCVRP
ncbi:MAG TPA: prepilin-type N-terminal cleavage/methylation domain-containing protein [Candidatus Paceibacterota bacterium]